MSTVGTISVSTQPADDDPDSAPTYTVDIFGTRATDSDTGADVATFFSKHLHQPVRLIYIGRNGLRAVPTPSLIPRRPATAGFPWFSNDEVYSQQIRFNDAAPLLLTTTASKEDARSRVPAELVSDDVLLRFRTNIHVDVSDTNSDAYDEDNWRKIAINSKASSAKVDLDIVFRTPRC